MGYWDSSIEVPERFFLTRDHKERILAIVGYILARFLDKFPPGITDWEAEVISTSTTSVGVMYAKNDSAFIFSIEFCIGRSKVAVTRLPGSEFPFLVTEVEL